MADVIVHHGIVESVDGDRLQVKILQTSACASCSAKGHCLSSESKEKIIDIHTPDHYSYSIGEEVIVTGEVSKGMMAVFLAFIVPFFVLVITLFTAMFITNNNELLSGGISLGLLAIYYIVLAFNKGRVKKNLSFKIKHINNN